MSKKTLNRGLGNWMVVDGVPEEEALKEDNFGIGQSMRKEPLSCLRGEVKWEVRVTVLKLRG